MRIFQNKIILGGCCIITAAVFAFILLPKIYSDKSKTEKIIKVNTDIQAGTQIEDAMLTETEVGKYGLPENVIKDKSEIIGKYAGTDIMAEDLILQSKISEYCADERLDKAATEGKKLITVTLQSVASGVGNHINSGDIISVYCYDNEKVKTYDELKNIEVYSIENDDAQDIDEVRNDEKSNKIASTVTLIADESQIEKLIMAEYSGKLHAVLERKGKSNE